MRIQHYLISKSQYISQRQLKMWICLSSSRIRKQKGKSSGRILPKENNQIKAMFVSSGYRLLLMIPSYISFPVGFISVMSFLFHMSVKANGCNNHATIIQTRKQSLRGGVTFLSPFPSIPHSFGNEDNTDVNHLYMPSTFHVLPHYFLCCRYIFIFIFQMKK